MDEDTEAKKNAEEQSQEPPQEPAEGETPSEADADAETPPEPQQETPPEAAATEPAPEEGAPEPEPPAAGPSPGARVAAFSKQIPDDFRAARRTASLAMTIRTLERDKTDRDKELDAALRAPGAAAEEAGAEADLPAAEGALAARQGLQEAEAGLEEKLAAFKTARDALGDEQKSHTDIIREREAEYQPLADARNAANAATTGLGRKVSAAEKDSQRLQNELAKAQQAQAAPKPAEGEQAAAPPPKPTRSLEEIQADIDQLEADREASHKELDEARQAQAAAQAAADAKAQEVKAAKQAWDSRKAELTEAVQAAEGARTSAQAAVEEARTALGEGHLTFGRAIFDAESAAQEIAEPMSKAKQAAAAIAQLDTQIAEKQAEKDSLKGGTQRFAITAGAAAVLLLLIILLLVWIFWEPAARGEFSPWRRMRRSAEAAPNHHARRGAGPGPSRVEGTPRLQSSHPICANLRNLRRGLLFPLRVPRCAPCLRG